MFSSEQILKLKLSERAVFKTKAPEYLDNDIPHYFIVVAVDDSDYYICVCTTQVLKRYQYLSSRNISLETLIEVQPDESNGLTENSYIDCNNSFLIEYDKIKAKLECGDLNFKGTISQESYDNLIVGIQKSELNDIPKFLINQK